MTVTLIEASEVIEAMVMAVNHNEIQDRLRARLKLQLAELMEDLPNGQASTPEDRKSIQTSLNQTLKNVLDDSRGAIQLAPEDQQRMVQDVIQEVMGFDILDQLINDPTISEIMVNGPHEIFVERDGKLLRVEAKFRDTNHLMSIIERMLGTVNLTVNEASPLCDASLPDGSRINVIIPPLTLNGPVMTIRRKSGVWTMQEFIDRSVLSQEAAEFLQGCITAKVNFIISGGTSSGKTTLVSVLAAFIPQDHRIITIENVAELELPSRDHWIRVVGKAANLEGKGEIPLRTLVKNALRMRPDRMILGEARGGEALDVVQAMHSGHDGFMTVLHANSSRAALERLETLMLMSGLDLPPAACRTQIASAVDLVVHVGRFVDGSRRIAAISQVLGSSQEGFQMEDLFVFESEGFTPEGKLQGTCRYTGKVPKCLAKFRINNVPIPSWVKT